MEHTPHFSIRIGYNLKNHATKSPRYKKNVCIKVLKFYNDQQFNFLQGLALSAHSITTGKEIQDIYCSETVNIPEPKLLAVMCTRSREQSACRILINAADDALHLMQQGGKIFLK